MAEVTTKPGVTGNSIRLFSGGFFDFSNPKPEDIRLADIAHGLSMTCRFAGQLPRFYSVAEHSVHCLHVAREVVGIHTLKELRSVLLHDASEAYAGDVPSPLKSMLHNYRVIEKNIEAAVEWRFDIKHSGVVKEIDLILLKAEKNAFTEQDQWHDMRDVWDVKIDFRCWRPEVAEYHFLEAAKSLGLFVE